MMIGVRVRPVSRESLIDSIATEAVERAAGDRLRVAIDGAAGLAPDVWAGALVEELRGRGGFALHVSVRDFLLPASQRFEFGRTSPEAFYEGWRDERGLRREVLDPAAPAGSDRTAAGDRRADDGREPGTGRVLPALWRTDIDRSARADYVTVPPGGIVVVSGEFL